ncbi:uncharacterized protein LOC123499127 [Portunus trituberculatus]|uniref:uncharacterized protein LOC123499127 n=1 Tax=Portunus trituberculatus TaxID=210409 RepID=UPI001E1CFD4A|nr:uncharacterized protein LOC123499127 [Portunus trituberculatus]
MASIGAPVCVVRRYKPEDMVAAQDIVGKAVMETVTDYFWSAVLSEVLPQVALLTIAFSYIGLGIPFYFCLLGIPTAVVIIYAVIWLAHMSKALEVGQEMTNIPRLFLEHSDCCFWVAEVLECSEASDLDALMNKMKKVEYHFMGEEESSAREAELQGIRRHVVGILGLTKSRRGGMKGWLRHLAVKKAYRLRGIAQQLLDEAIHFSTEHCLNEIELVATECHHKARELFYKKGFEVQHTYFKYYFNVQQPFYIFSLPVKPPKAELSEISSL